MLNRRLWKPYYQKGSITAESGQTLHPFLSKENRNIPSETKEDNMNLQGNVCSDDYRLAIFKEIKMNSHSRFGTSQQEGSENFDSTKKLCDFIPKKLNKEPVGKNPRKDEYQGG